VSNYKPNSGTTIFTKNMYALSQYLLLIYIFCSLFTYKLLRRWRTGQSWPTAISNSYKTFTGNRN